MAYADPIILRKPEYMLMHFAVSTPFGSLLLIVAERMNGHFHCANWRLFSEDEVQVCDVIG